MLSNFRFIKAFLLAKVGLIFVFGQLNAQVTVKVMHNNLTNYGNYTSYCTSTNNNVSVKAQNLKKIIKYVNPDIFTVNEIKPLTYFVNHLRDSVLNTDGVNYYSSCSISNNAMSDIVNMLYYDNRKFGLAYRTYIPTSLRDIDVFKLYYKSPTLSTLHDTIFLYCIVAHLKAGNTSSDEATRAQMTLQIQNYLNSINQPLNILLMGDLNLYKSSEQAYQNLVSASNPNARFYDPINKPGNWSNNPSYSNYHTQSTHYDNNGCFSSGGLDDRFDFILISQNIKDGLDRIQYLNNSYKALGQDGNHFDKSVNDGYNTAVPAEIADALYYSSDHLPIILELVIDAPANVAENDENYNFDIQLYRNNTDYELVFFTNTSADFKIDLFTIDGKTIESTILKNVLNFSKYNIKFGEKAEGLYLLKVTNIENSKYLYKKIFK